MKKFNYLIAFVSIVLISSSIQAEPRKQEKSMLPMDRDNNGVISFKEFSSKSEKMFSFLDQNSDGSITKQEMAIGEQARKEKMLSKMAARLDRNDDLKIDKNEFISGSKGLPNHPQKTKRKGPPHGKMDGKKEVNEAIFIALDKDKDGFLTNKELAEGREVGPQIAKDIRFKKLDSNDNNKVSKEEFMFPIKQKFTDLDTNSDQLIDRRELMGSHQAKAGKEKIRKGIRQRQEAFKADLREKVESGEITEEEAEQRLRDFQQRIKEYKEGTRKRDESYKNNMWKGRPPTMHKERKRR